MLMDVHFHFAILHCTAGVDRYLDQLLLTCPRYLGIGFTSHPALCKDFCNSALAHLEYILKLFLWLHILVRLAVAFFKGFWDMETGIWMLWRLWVENRGLDLGIWILWRLRVKNWDLWAQNWGFWAWNPRI